MEIKKFTPAIDKRILVLLAGFVWCGTGVMLVLFAVSWLSLFNWIEQGLFCTAGFLAALPIHHFGFLKIADKNLIRLLPLTLKRCLFSFMTWKNYLIVFIMVLMGIALRHLPIPKNYLSILYNGIGFALFFSSIRYFRFFVKVLLKNET
jgi:hypothetical protein